MLAQSSRRPLVRNAILASLSSDLAAISGFMEPIALRERMIVHAPKKQVEHVYFVESGLVSLRIVAAGSMLETAVVGYRGAVGASFLWGGHLPIYQSVVILSGDAFRIPVGDLYRLMSERPRIREHLSRYVQALSLHNAQIGLCGVRHSREQRLACWICLTCDAIDGRVLPVTHDYLSAALGLRRSGVTETLIRFEEKGYICKMRGILRVDDRERLELEACSCYGIIANAYVSSETPAYVVGREEEGPERNLNFFR